MNGRDLVPRSLGKALSPAISKLQAKYSSVSSLSHWFFFRPIWEHLLSVADGKAMHIEGVVPWASEALRYLEAMRSGYLPLGTYHLLMKGCLSTVDSASQPDLLSLGLFGIMQILDSNVKTLYGAISGYRRQQFDIECVYSHNMQHKDPDHPRPHAETYITSLGKVFQRVQISGRGGTLHLDWTSASPRPSTTGLFANGIRRAVLHLTTQLQVHLGERKGGGGRRRKVPMKNS